MMMNRQHMLTHSNCIVDSQYVYKTGDNAYEVNRRNIVKGDDLGKSLDVVGGCIRFFGIC